MRVAIIIWAVLSPLWVIFLVHLATKLPKVTGKVLNTMEKPKAPKQRRIGYLQGVVFYSGKAKDFKGIC